MGIDDFETEACKQILLNPRSVKEVQCKRLKLNINPTNDLNFFKCASISVCKQCSNFSTCRCRCGKLMNHEIQLAKADQFADSMQNGVFVRGRSSFIITDDFKVAVRSTELVLKELKSLGYGDVSKLDERVLDIGFEEVMTLLQCIFSSNAPLTDTFLNKQSPQDVMKTCETLSPYMERKIDESEAGPEEVITFSAVVRKHDKKILYVECGEDFVDLVFSFLAVPLESVLEISGNISTFGCIGNLFKSSKDLISATTSKAKLQTTSFGSDGSKIPWKRSVNTRYRIREEGHKVYSIR